MLNAKNENIKINGHDFDYISFGSGREVLIMLPGVGDGFKMAKGVAVPFSVMYQEIISLLLFLPEILMESLSFTPCQYP